jgi:hypothetical protein
MNPRPLPLARCRGQRSWTSLLLVASGVVALGGFAAPLSLSGQVQRESQLPVSPDGGIIEISSELRDRLALFPEVQGFRTARLFLREDGITILELEAVRQGRLERERRVLSEPELVALRDLLAVRLAELGVPTGLDRGGRGGLVLGHTLLGLAYHGWAIPVAFDIDSGRSIVAAYLLTAGASFFVPYRLTRNRPVSEAHRDLSMYGGTRGILYGVLAADAFLDSDASDPARARLGGGIIGSLAGSILGFAVADRARPDDGRAALWSAMGDFGLLGGAGLAYVSGPYTSRDVIRRDGDFEYVESEARNRSVGHAITLAGGIAGLGTGRWLGRVTDYTEGNVSALRSAGILGAQIGATVTRATGTEDGQVIMAGTLAGGAVGIWAGNRFLSDRRLSNGEGLLINAGHLAGGATALGITYLVVEEMDDHPVLYLTTSTLGSVLGAGLVARAVGRGSASPLRFGLAAPSGSRRRAAGPPIVELRPENLFLSLTTSRTEALSFLTVRF